MANLTKLSLREIASLIFALIGVAIVLSVLIKYIGFGITDLVP